MHRESINNIHTPWNVALFAKKNYSSQSIASVDKNFVSRTAIIPVKYDA